MRQFLVILNLLLLIFLITAIAKAQEDTPRKVNIQIYREGPDGNPILKDTVLVINKLEEIQRILEELGVQETQSGAFLIDKRNVTIQSHIEEGKKQVNIVRIQGDQISGLDSATQAKVQLALKTANIHLPIQHDSTARKQISRVDNPNQYIANWDSTTLSYEDFQSKEVVLQKKDFSEGLERNLSETLSETEIQSLLDEMDVNIQIAGERPQKEVAEQVKSIFIFQLELLSEKDHLLLQPFEKAGLSDTLSLNTLSFLPIEDVYVLNVDLEDSGDMAVYIRDVTGNIIFQEVHKSFTGNYRKELELSSGLGTLLFLNIAQNGKMKTVKLSKVEVQK